MSYGTVKIRKDDGGENLLSYDGGAWVSISPAEVAALRSRTNAGTVAAGFSVVEAGNKIHHVTTLTAAATMPAIAGGAALSVGKLAYTFPAGVCLVHGSYMSMALTAADGNIDADTPDGGLGTVIAAGANATLNLTAGAENVMTGQTFNNCTGTAEVKTVGTQLVIEAADAHTLYFNLADTWAASGETALPVAGTIVLDWSFLA